MKRKRPTQLKVDRARNAILRWIIKKRLPLNTIKGDDFAEVVLELNDELKDYITPNGDTVRSWIIAEFESQKAQVKQELQASLSKTHLTFDLWTSDNGLALLGVVSHYLDQEMKARSVAIVLKTVDGVHSGENIAPVMISVIDEFEIGSKLGYFVTDNAGNNDTCIAILCEHYFPSSDPDIRRLRCLGHIINLAAKAFLFGRNAEAFESTIQDLTLRKLDEKHRRELLECWRRCGPVGKLHNMTTAIRVTPQRRQLFESCQGVDDVSTASLMVTRDQATRWNSTYNMIHRALKLRYRITEFCTKFRQEVEDDWLTENDWQQLTIIESILKHFYSATKRMEGNAERGHHGSMWEGLPCVEAILGKLEAAKITYTMTEHPEIAQSLNLAWEKLEQYYSLMDDSPAYAAAVMLNPSHRIKYFDTHWKVKDLKKHLGPTKKKLRDLYDSEYTMEKLSRNRYEYPESSSSSSEDDLLDEYLNANGKRVRGEYDRYNKPQDSDFKLPKRTNLYNWWFLQAGTMPRLTQMAYDFLSIPAMSSECERLFSGAKLTVTPQRQRLKADIVEAIEMMNKWYRRGLVRLPGDDEIRAVTLRYDNYNLT